MNLEEKRLVVTSLENLPSIQAIKSIKRGVNLKIEFEHKIKSKREEIGEGWKSQLPEFSIGIHTIKDEINILKLITDQEIEQHQLFFEKCAQEYGILGSQLIHRFVREFEVKSHEGFPLRTLNPYRKTQYEQGGNMGEWKYFFHGFHCAFTHKKTKQYIEVPLTYGDEYGELDPYFFSKFIKSTPKFQPLPIGIYDDFSDGLRILEVMEKIGKFEKIESNLKGRKGFIVKDRVKQKVITFENGMAEVFPDLGNQKKKLSFWQRIKNKLK